MVTLYHAINDMAAIQQCMAQQMQSGYQPVAPKEPSQLEAVLQQIHDIWSQLGSAADRALLLADRLFGPQPLQPPEPGAAGPCLNSAQPPMIARMESALADAGAVLNTLNNHLERLSRL